jgi:hypothetical protein
LQLKNEQKQRLRANENDSQLQRCGNRNLGGKAEAWIEKEFAPIGASLV